LEQVVVALGNKARDHVPYRQSKLTHMLKDSLGGNCKTTMISNVWPEANKIEETSSTLRFATRMMRVSNDATVNVHLDPALLIRKYERQIKDLKQELAMHDTLAGRSRVQYEEYTPDEQAVLETKVQQYLDGEIQEIDVASLRMVYEAFGIFRKMHQQLRAELQRRPEDRRDLPEAEVAEGGGEVPAGQEKGEEVGTMEEGKGISVGVAPSNLRPKEEDRGANLGDTGEVTDGYRADTTAPLKAGDDERPPDKQVSFTEWKAKEGITFEEAFEKNRQDLKAKRADAKDTLVLANNKKRAIDEAKDRLARKRADRDADTSRDEELIDEEEYAIIQTLKDLKQQYRDAFEQHRIVKMDVSHIEHNMQQTKLKLVSAFEGWFDERYGHIARDTMAADTLAKTEMKGERFDPQEQFDMMETERLETQHPDALAYHKARKNAARDVRMRKR